MDTKNDLCDGSLRNRGGLRWYGWHQPQGTTFRSRARQNGQEET